MPIMDYSYNKSQAMFMRTKGLGQFARFFLEYKNIESAIKLILSFNIKHYNPSTLKTTILQH